MKDLRLGQFALGINRNYILSSHLNISFLKIINLILLSCELHQINKITMLLNIYTALLKRCVRKSSVES